MKRLILLLAVCLPAFSQYADYTAFDERNLTAAAGAVTIQQPASPTRTARIRGASIYCSVACTATLEHNTTGATTTAFATSSASPGLAASTILARHTSNVAVGTVVNKYSVSAGETKVIDSTMILQPTAGLSFTLRVATMTGTIRITWQWVEE